MPITDRFKQKPKELTTFVLVICPNVIRVRVCVRVHVCKTLSFDFKDIIKISTTVTLKCNDKRTGKTFAFENNNNKRNGNTLRATTHQLFKTTRTTAVKTIALTTTSYEKPSKEQNQ